MKTDPYGIRIALFSLKCFAAAMLAYFIALRIGLPKPYWSITTAYVVSQPFSGTALQKALFRLLGTALGASVAVALVPTLVNAPTVLSIALALWLGLCLYISLLDRTPRSYIFLLAGYTASIIAFPSVGTPDQIFNIAIARVQEIGLGVVSASLVHGLIFPTPVMAALLERVDAALSDAEKWSVDTLRRSAERKLPHERHHLAADITELHRMASHIPFDTARLLPNGRTVGQLEDQLSLLLPLTEALDDRLTELERNGIAISSEIQDLLNRTCAWLADDLPRNNRASSVAALREAASQLARGPEAVANWSDAVRLNLCQRLDELIAAHHASRLLRDELHDPAPLWRRPHVDTRLSNPGHRRLHSDYHLALRSGLGAILGVLSTCAIWIATAWPEGGMAAFMAGVCCALFVNLDAPMPALRNFVIGGFLGVVAAGIYDFAILPRATDFMILASLLAPGLLVLGAALTQPKLIASALGVVAVFPGTVGFADRYAGSFGVFANAGLAQLCGGAIAIACVQLLQEAGHSGRVARLLQAGKRTIARQCDTRNAMTASGWMSQMLDRISILASVITIARDGPAPISEMLRDVRVGLAIDEMREGAKPLDCELKSVFDSAFQLLAGYYASPDSVSPDDKILSAIDLCFDCLPNIASEATRYDLASSLVSLRRSLFPKAQIPCPALNHRLTIVDGMISVGSA